MNILYLAHRIPYPPTKGDKIRSFHQIEYLGPRHRVHLACLVDAPEDRAHAAKLRTWCASVDAAWRGRASSNARAALALAGARSLSVAAFHSPELARRVARLAREEEIDVVIVFSSQMGQYVPAGLPTVVDFVDMDSEKWRLYAGRKPWPLSWLYRLEADRLRDYERHLAEIHEESVFITKDEADLFVRSVGVRARAIRSGVDLDYFRRPEGGARGTPALVFVGMMDYFPNVDAVAWFAEEIFPRVLASCPDAVFRIVGRNPVKRVLELGRRKNVEVVGGVPDVRPYLTDDAVSVAPFRIARGLQNKVLEAMAMEVPVVGTSPAWQGIEAGPEDGVRVENEPEGFARAAVALLRDPEARREAGRRERMFVEGHHRWQDHGAALEALLLDVVARRARPEAAEERR